MGEDVTSSAGRAQSIEEEIHEATEKIERIQEHLEKLKDRLQAMFAGVTILCCMVIIFIVWTYLNLQG